MKKSVFTLASVIAISSQSFAGNCGFHNLVGEWTRTTELASTPDPKCGAAVQSEKTIFTFVSKAGGKVSGSGLRVTVKTFKNSNFCSPKTNTFNYPFVELISNGRLSIVSENGAQAISNCDVSSDRSKLKIGNVAYLRIK